MDPGEVSLEQVYSHRLEQEGLNPSVSVSRTLVVTRLGAQNDAPAALEIMSQLIEQLLGRGGVSFTGVLIAQGNSLIHMFEAPCEVSLQFVDRIERSARFSRMAQESRVLYSVQDVPDRFFPDWFSIQMKEKRESDFNLSAEDTMDVVEDIAHKFKSMSERIQQDSARRQPEFSQYSELIPSLDRVLALTTSEDFMTTPEFLESFDKPVQLLLESESVWPLEPVVRY